VPRATSEDSPSKPVDKPHRKLFSADDSHGDVVSGNRPDCKLVVEGDKGQAKTLADSKDSGDPSSSVSGREWMGFNSLWRSCGYSLGQVLAGKDVIIMHRTVVYKIIRFSPGNRNECFLGCATPRNNTLCAIPIMLSNAL
jgi:hypothetical protein